MTLSVGPALPSELPQVLNLLKECELPRDGVEEHLGGFLVARDERALVGVVGLECYGDVGLLRSLAVSPRARQLGIGRKLVDALVDEARRKKVSVLYLLTETADEYFHRFGFVRVARESVDPRLQASYELQGACPETAGVMRAQL